MAPAPKPSAAMASGRIQSVFLRLLITISSDTSFTSFRSFHLPDASFPAAAPLRRLQGAQLLLVVKTRMLLSHPEYPCDVAPPSRDREWDLRSTGRAFPLQRPM